MKKRSIKLLIICLITTPIALLGYAKAQAGTDKGDVDVTTTITIGSINGPGDVVTSDPITVDTTCYDVGNGQGQNDMLGPCELPTTTTLPICEPLPTGMVNDLPICQIGSTTTIVDVSTPPIGTLPHTGSTLTIIIIAFALVFLGGFFYRLNQNR